MDKFRIKLWDTTTGGNIVYDIQVGTGVNTSDTASPVTAISGGDIQIHS